MSSSDAKLVKRKTTRYWIFGRERVVTVPLYCVLRASLKEVENPKQRGVMASSVIIELFDGEEDALMGERDDDEMDIHTLQLTMFNDTVSLELKHKIVELINEYLERFRTYANLNLNVHLIEGTNSSQSLQPTLKPKPQLVGCQSIRIIQVLDRNTTLCSRETQARDQ